MKNSIYDPVIYVVAIASMMVCGCGTDSTSSSEKTAESGIVVTSEKSVSRNSSSVPVKNKVIREQADKSETAAESHSGREKKTLVETDEPSLKTTYRPSDVRPVHNNQRLALLGIHCYESPRLKLYTDIDPQVAMKLPGIVDQAYLALEKYFGALPPDREGTEFQVTGYIMQNRERFKKAGVILESLPAIVNGRHHKAQFWMDYQSENYYLRHLMLHEYTHCFSMIMENIGAPVWYLEGIAESMATHTLDNEGKYQFNVMPHNKNDFAGLGRITLIQQAIQTAPPKTLLEVMQLGASDFVGNNESYAWAWALCQFFDKHPRYAKSFRKLSRHMQGTEFSSKIQQIIAKDYTEIADAWLLFAGNLQPGYDFERGTISFQPGLPIDRVNGSASAMIVSDRGWQSSEIHVEKGSTYHVVAEGMFTLAEKPKPWESTVEGITFRYFKGQPLGRLMMLFRPDPDSNNSKRLSILKEYPLGANATWMAPVSGTVYFRLNDAWNQLADNKGDVKITVTHK